MNKIKLFGPMLRHFITWTLASIWMYAWFAAVFGLTVASSRPSGSGEDWLLLLMTRGILPGFALFPLLMRSSPLGMTSYGMDEFAAHARAYARRLEVVCFLFLCLLIWLVGTIGIEAGVMVRQMDFAWKQVALTGAAGLLPTVIGAAGLAVLLTALFRRMSLVMFLYVVIGLAVVIYPEAAPWSSAQSGWGGQGVPPLIVLDAAFCVLFGLTAVGVRQRLSEMGFIMRRWHSVRLSLPRRVETDLTVGLRDYRTSRLLYELSVAGWGRLALGLLVCAAAGLTHRYFDLWSTMAAGAAVILIMPVTAPGGACDAFVPRNVRRSARFWLPRLLIGILAAAVWLTAFWLAGGKEAVSVWLKPVIMVLGFELLAITIIDRRLARLMVVSFWVAMCALPGGLEASAGLVWPAAGLACAAAAAVGYRLAG